jgi:GTP cyclohydrolase II
MLETGLAKACANPCPEKERDLPVGGGYMMQDAGNNGFQIASATMSVERAVAELRFGRPIILKDGPRQLAVLALDCVAPCIYDQFAAAVDNQHRLLLTAERSNRLGLGVDSDVTISLDGISFDQASDYAYKLHGQAPDQWMRADPLISASAELASLALLLPAMVCAEIENIEHRFSACQTLSTEQLRDSNNARQTFQQVVRTRVPLKDIGNVDFVVFRGGLAQKDQVAIVVGKPDSARPVPVRIHSSCITGDLCGSLKCDCGDQLRNGLSLLKQAGGGVLLYLDQEGRGTGIGAKMRAYGYQHQGLDTIDADSELGFKQDHRRYESAAAMLRLLDIAEVVLFTNNPTKIDGLKAGGIKVKNRVTVTGEVTEENINYLRTKTLRAGHMLNLDAIIAAE